MNPLGIFYISFASFYAVFVALSCVMYWRSCLGAEQTQKLNNQVSKRSGKLGILTSLGGAALVMISAVDTSFSISGIGRSCITVILLTNIAYLVSIAACTSRGVRLFVQYRINCIKADFHKYSPAVNDLTKPFKITLSDLWRLNVIGAKELEHLSPDDAFKLITFYKRYLDENLYLYGCGVYLIVGLLLQLIAFLSLGTTYQVAIDYCSPQNQTILYMPLYAAVGLSIFVAVPVLLYFLRDVKDAYNILSSLKLFTVLGSLAFVYYFIVTEVPILKNIVVLRYIPADIIGIIADVVIHVQIIVRPLLQNRGVYRQRRAHFNLKAIPQDFMKCIAHQETYEMLKQCTVEEFCSENSHFWEQYLSLMQKSYLALIGAFLSEITGLSPDVQDIHQDDKQSKRQSFMNAINIFKVPSNGSSDKAHTELESRLQKLKADFSKPYSRALIEYLISDEVASIHSSHKSNSGLSGVTSNPGSSTKQIPLESQPTQSSINKQSSAGAMELRDSPNTNASRHINKELPSPLQDQTHAHNWRATFKNSNVQAPLSRQLAGEFVRTFEEYLVDSAQYQLNVPAEVISKLTPAIEQIRMYANEQTAQNQQFFIGMNEEVITEANGKIIIPIGLYSEVNSHVLDMLFSNTYPRLVKKQQFQTTSVLQSMSIA
ncbi:hypothetical protein MIR68_002405 [Amoeboaphelidium protococcarum]|nr:hypothetical protein MIR68_002405 [Amoeboaphelidium protococcarum]